MKRSSPTPNRLPFYLLVFVGACGQRAPDGPWKMAAADADSAYFQGKQADATSEKVYLRPPDDGIVRLTGCFAYWGELAEVVGNVYGFANAAVIWSDDVRGRMYKIGFKSHSLDVMLVM